MNRPYDHRVDGTTVKNAADLAIGDLVVVAGATFEITSKRCIPGQPAPLEVLDCYVHETRCLNPDAFGGPRHWADSWIVQGNKLARFTVINLCAKIIARTIPGYNAEGVRHEVTFGPDGYPLMIRREVDACGKATCNRTIWKQWRLKPLSPKLAAVVESAYDNVRYIVDTRKSA